MAVGLGDVAHHLDGRRKLTVKLKFLADDNTVAPGVRALSTRSSVT